MQQVHCKSKKSGKEAEEFKVEMHIFKAVRKSGKEAEEFKVEMHIFKATRIFCIWFVATSVLAKIL